MFLKKYTNYILILTGSFVAVYAQAEEQQNTLVLVAGILILMFGLYRVSRTIPNKKNENENDSI